VPKSTPIGAPEMKSPRGAVNLKLRNPGLSVGVVFKRGDVREGECARPQLGEEHARLPREADSAGKPEVVNRHKFEKVELSTFCLLSNDTS